MTKRTLLISIPVVALVLNGVGYLIVTKVRAPSRAAAPDITARGSTAPGQSVGNGAEKESGKQPGNSAGSEESGEDSNDPKAKEQRAMARRAAGLTALEAGNYQKALINFTEAKVLIGEKAHVDELLQVTEDLRTRPVTAPAKSRPAPLVQAVSSSKAAGRGGSVRRIAAKEDTPTEVTPPPSTLPPPSSPSGLLIVTTTPRGILVQVDETPVDLTPMRTKVKPGPHRIALLDGDRKVYETTMDVKDGATATLLKDLSAERAAAEAARPTAPTPGPSAMAKEESARMVPGTILPPPPPPAPAVPVRTVAASVRGTDTVGPSFENGALDISSPGLYGVVWINGRPRGYPPLVVYGLPAGSTKVEVRVNGIQKRTSTVTVKPGLTTSVKLRSQETSP